MNNSKEKIASALTVLSPKLMGAKYEMTDTSLLIPDGVEYDIVEKMVCGMKTINDSVRFWLGDLLVYAERSYGEKYSQLVDETDYSYQSLRDMMWVSNNVSPEVRRNDLTWSHHREVAKLKMDEQEKLLWIAAERQLSVASLRQLINNDNDSESKPTKGTVYEAALKTIVTLATPDGHLEILRVAKDALSVFKDK